MKYFKLLGILLFSATTVLSVENPMVVIVPSYNNKMWYDKNLYSIFSQEYSNFRVIYIDDCSPDGTGELVRAWLNRLGFADRCTLICNTERHGAMANIYTIIHSLTHDEEIIVLCDGDDWFAHEHVLERINQEYDKDGIWLTHGSFEEWPKVWEGWRDFSKPISKEVIETHSFRKSAHPSHARTFYSWLFKKIKREDLMYEDDFFQMAWDQAMMLPMVEMAGYKHAFISEILYIYNIANSLNDNKVNAQLQRDLESIILSRPVYQCLSKGLTL